jgi:serine/tyrosine/threonine adenylyltransferase
MRREPFDPADPVKTLPEAPAAPDRVPAVASDLADVPAARFRARFVERLIADPDQTNRPRQAPGASYTRVMPTAIRTPRLLAWSRALGDELGLRRPDDPAGPTAEVLAGNRIAAGMLPYAARYGGHQFGTWAGQLGDGRAITLGELCAPDGRVWELQLKGAGPTPYSRRADGRAVLRSSLREFLCSEAMHFLGVPTTRALSLAATGETVVRDMFYDGNPEDEPGAVVCRVAPSFVRFGNFQIHASHDEIEPLRRLVDYVIDQHYPQFAAIDDPVERVAAWFEEVCRRTAVMVAHWMRVGFVHGVMNTDNMSILGLTIDYGPYGWLEGYEPDWTPNTTDADGKRYCFGRQPQIALWNLARLAEALLALADERSTLLGDLQRGLDRYGSTFESESRRMLGDKLGLAAIDAEHDGPLIEELFALLQSTETDMTIFHRALAKAPVAGGEDDAALLAPLEAAFYATAAERPAGHAARLAAWLRRYGERVRTDTAGDPVRDAERIVRMNRANPKYVPRNYLAQLAIDAAAAGDMSVLDRLLNVLARPYDEQPGHEDLAVRRPDWARRKAGCSMLSCSS